MAAPPMSVPILNTKINNSCEALILSHGNSTAPLAANLDISGIGIIISFVVSAYVVFCAALFCWIFNLLPVNVLSAYDKAFCRKKVDHGPDRQPAYNAFFRTLAVGVLAFSDTQILQGLAILIAAFVNVGSMSVFDWQIVCYLAWMSSNVHLTTLLFVQDFLHKQPIVLAVRVTGMLLLLILLLVAFIPTSTWNWILAVTRVYDRNNYPDDGGPFFYALNYAMPVECFWHRPYDTHGKQPVGFEDKINPDAPFAYLALLLTYGWRIYILVSRRPERSFDEESKLSGTILTPFSKQWRTSHGLETRGLDYKLQMFQLKIYARRAQTIAQQIQERVDSGKQTRKLSLTSTWYNVRFRFYCILYATTLAVFDFFRSFVAALWILLLLLLWGTFEVANVRNKALPETHKALDQWQFGQILPMILLAVPLLAIAQHFMRDHDEKPKGKREVNIMWEAVLDGNDRFKASTSRLLHRLRPSNLSTTCKHTYSRARSYKEKYNDYRQKYSDPSHTHPPLALFDWFQEMSYPLTPEAAKDVSLNYFYKDWWFRTMLFIPNVMALTGGIVALLFEGRSVVQNGAQLQDEGRSSIKDPKGWVFEYIGIILAAAFGFWCLWALLVMFLCGLFTIPQSLFNHPESEDGPLVEKRTKIEPALPVAKHLMADGQGSSSSPTPRSRAPERGESRIVSQPDMREEVDLQRPAVGHLQALHVGPSLDYDPNE